MQSKWLALVCITLMFIFSVIAYPQLPERVPIQWDTDGSVTNTTNQFAGAFMFPGLAALIVGAYIVRRWIDPRRENYSRFEGTFWLYINLAVLVLAGLQFITLGQAFGWEIPAVRLVIAGCGLVVLFLGNSLSRIQPNWFMGVRTPWTLSDDEVWRQTHRMGARLRVGVGLLTVVLAFLLPLELVPPMFLVLLVGAAVVTIAYSYLVWHRLYRA